MPGWGLRTAASWGQEMWRLIRAYFVCICVCTCVCVCMLRTSNLRSTLLTNFEVHDTTQLSIESVLYKRFLEHIHSLFLSIVHSFLCFTNTEHWPQAGNSCLYAQGPTAEADIREGKNNLLSHVLGWGMLQKPLERNGTDSRAEKCLLVQESRFTELNVENHIDIGFAGNAEKWGQTEGARLPGGFEGKFEADLAWGWNQNAKNHLCQVGVLNCFFFSFPETEQHVLLFFFFFLL